MQGEAAKLSWHCDKACMAFPAYPHDFLPLLRILFRTFGGVIYEKNMDKTKILFICLGNICRSPAADAVMRKLVDEAGLADKFTIDSAGIGAWHVGQLPDRRMRKHGANRGYKIDHIARQFDAATDFDKFDMIVVMDDDNYRNISRQAHNGKDMEKVVRMADYFSGNKRHDCVPDPYYGDDSAFDHAIDLIEDGCRGILATLSKQPRR